MKIPMTQHPWLVGLIVAGASPLLAPTDGACVGESGAQFLKIGVGAKACAMGEAFVALADDPSAVYWNPAGMTTGRSIRVLGMHAAWLEGMSYQYLSSTIPSPHGHIGLALAYSSSGNIPGRNKERAETGDYGAYDAAFTVAYARKAGTGLSIGVATKLIQQKIEEESATGFALDAGALYERLFVDSLRVAFVAQNIGPEIKFVQDGDPLPLALRAGIAYTHRSFTATADLHKPRFEDLRFHVGGELLVRSVLALRAGYFTRPELSGAVTAGLGVSWRAVRVEYAFVPHEEINDTNRFAVTVRR